MTLDEAIQHCEEVADTPCFTDEEAKCYSEHRQLAEWLKELKAYREQGGDAISRKYILDLIATKGANLDDDLLIVEQWIQDAPSVNPHPIECGDAISRQAAKKALEDRFIELQKRHSENRYETNFCLNTILELPSVTPQQRTGRWERMSDLPNDVDDRFKCSRCGNIVHYNNVMDLRTFSRWCGRCGSDNG